MAWSTANIILNVNWRVQCLNSVEKKGHFQNKNYQIKNYYILVETAWFCFDTSLVDNYLLCQRCMYEKYKSTVKLLKLLRDHEECLSALRLFH